uniref:Uncharacterized protein n=1 Tax=Romanomermis culicivorax TaxID=13658 RepID=A0A915JN20_ROMCU
MPVTLRLRPRQIDLCSATVIRLQLRKIV